MPIIGPAELKMPGKAAEASRNPIPSQPLKLVPFQVPPVGKKTAEMVVRGPMGSACCMLRKLMLQPPADRFQRRPSQLAAARSEAGCGTQSCAAIQRQGAPDARRTRTATSAFQCGINRASTIAAGEIR